FPRRFLAVLSLFAAALAIAPAAQAEDGYDLWLRHAPLEGEVLADLTARPIAIGSNDAGNPTVDIALTELKAGLASMTGVEPALFENMRDSTAGGTVIELDCDNPQIKDRGTFSLSGSPARAIIVASEPIGCL